MAIVNIRDNSIEEIDTIVQLSNGKYRSRADFVNRAAEEKLSLERPQFETAQVLADLLQKFPQEINETVTFVLSHAPPQEGTPIPKILSFLSDAERVILLKGEKTAILDELKKIPIMEIRGIYLVLEVPPTNDGEVLSFLVGIDDIIKSSTIKRVLFRTESGLNNKILGRLMVKIKKEEELKDGKAS